MTLPRLKLQAHIRERTFEFADAQVSQRRSVRNSPFSVQFPPACPEPVLVTDRLSLELECEPLLLAGTFFHPCAHPMNDNTSRCDGSHEHDWRTCADFAEFIFDGTYIS
jgi:hypothetical protein